MNTASSLGDLGIEKETTRRIESAKKLLASVQAINEVDADMSFWVRRIRWALKRCERVQRKGKYPENYVTNAWSFHGNTSQLYLRELSSRLGPGFTVDRTYYQDELKIFEPLVVVSW